MENYSKIPIHKESPYIVNSIIEIEEGSRNKYEFDKNLNAFVFDRILRSAMVYPCNYGFIPNTMADDGDALDVLIYSPEPIKRATLVESRVIGCLDMEDGGFKDYKIFAVPSFFREDFSILKHLDPDILDIFENFFLRYKDLSHSKSHVSLKGWLSKEETFKIINESVLT